MAAKKSAKKTADSAPAGDGATPTPVAKKAATKKVAAKKAAAKKEPKKAPAKDAAPSPAPAAEVAPVVKKTAVAKKAAVKPSLDAIARAAYLNYRRRVEQGLPGDSHGDWLEAERQAAEQG